MTKRGVVVGAALATLLTAGSTLRAQTPPKPAPIPIKIQIVVTRYDGEKKIASLPYTLIGSTESTMTLNTGLQVAVINSVVGSPVSSGNGPLTSTPVTNFTYKPIGTNLSSLVTSQNDGKFKIDLTLDNSSVVPGNSAPGLVTTAPSFQSFTMRNNLIVADGQTVQYASVTDPGNGMVTKVDLTLTTLK
jgi:hypothetical protein